jgi:hypothetical protein
MSFDLNKGFIGKLEDNMHRYIIILLSVVIYVAEARDADLIRHIEYNAGDEIISKDFNISKVGGILKTLEGCAKITDQDGKLLFYTDGVNVYNKEHRQMPNGYRLMGNKSASHSGVVVPLPGSGSKYYIFTANRDKLMGVRYSIVDMEADGGLGDVVMKNMALRVPATEKVTSFSHNNGIDFWIVTHDWNNNSFFLYLLTSDGILPDPVISNIGSVHRGAEQNKIGFFRFSPDFKKLVSTIQGKGVLEVYDVDNKTGFVYNPILFESDLYNTEFDVEFSQNSSMLYITEKNSPAKVMQYDLRSGQREQVLKSGTLIYKSPNKDIFGSLEKSEDGKIYLTNYSDNFIGVVEQPDSQGIACGYRDYDESLDLNYASPEYLPLTFKRYIPTDITDPEYKENIDIEIIPGKTYEELTVNLKSVDDGNYLVEIFSMDGKIMESVEWKDNRENKNVNLYFNTSTYPSGIYFLVLKTGRQRISKSLAIRR